MIPQQTPRGSIDKLHFDDADILAESQAYEAVVVLKVTWKYRDGITICMIANCNTIFYGFYIGLRAKRECIKSTFIPEEDIFAIVGQAPIKQLLIPSCVNCSFKRYSYSDLEK